MNRGRLCPKGAASKQLVTSPSRQTVIHVDPRFTRTSALAGRHVPIQAGSDIVFLGALVNHVLSGGHYFRDYLVPYANAAALVSEDFGDTEDLGGLFAGWDERSGRYDPASGTRHWSTRVVSSRCSRGTLPGTPRSRRTGVRGAAGGVRRGR